MVVVVGRGGGVEGLKPHQFQLFLRGTMHAYYYNYCGKDLNVAHQLLNQGFIQIFCTALQHSGLVRTVGACAQRAASIPQTTELELETHFVERLVRKRRAHAYLDVGIFS